MGEAKRVGRSALLLALAPLAAIAQQGQGEASKFALSEAQRVEVLRGPFSSLYGNAAGGVIVLETQDGPEIPTGEASVSYGSYNSWRAGLKIGGTWGGLNAMGDLSRFETQGYREHSAATRDQANLKFKFALQEG